MKFERVPKIRRSPDPRPFLLAYRIAGGGVALFVGWFKLTLGRKP